MRRPWASSTAWADILAVVNHVRTVAEGAIMAQTTTEADARWEALRKIPRSRPVEYRLTRAWRGQAGGLKRPRRGPRGVPRTPAPGYPARMAGHLVIVRRGKPDRFEALETTFHEEPDITVVWDRRQGERRVGRGRPPTPDRRGPPRDRRGPPPFTWSVLDFLVAQGS